MSSLRIGVSRSATRESLADIIKVLCFPFRPNRNQSGQMDGLLFDTYSILPIGGSHSRKKRKRLHLMENTKPILPERCDR